LEEWIFDKIRVNVEENRHIDLLSGIEPLFLKAETLDFIEIETDFLRCYLIYSNTSNGFI